MHYTETPEYQKYFTANENFKNREVITIELLEQLYRDNPEK
jgi:hypothetical protein